ncbi:Phytanoyl-CoA dioxygenase (PhyH) [Marinomonas spartinae]|uniref:Ectoine hydroxylase n=1 Tax=Marinomonas spartinae TaxID=1792290 RepID=A0A1A8TAB3_9GAMM|nr:ectoine hydroxylase [Marinomonas spartinae]SBS28415.1 Phytanoyl-CoA dioxygenase (PhyH) [Marinomonas spartinae]
MSSSAYVLDSESPEVLGQTKWSVTTDEMLKKDRVVDDYPSRQYQKPTYFNRKDPVIFSDDRQKAPLDEALLDHYEKNGFLFLDHLFSEDEIAKMQRYMQCLRDDEFIKQREESITEANSGDICSVFDVHKLNDFFQSVAEDPRLVRIAEYILGDQVYLHQPRLNYKPGFRGKEFYWHSDFETWHVEDGMPRMRALSMSITLTPNDHNNGPLLVIPGSHHTYVSCVGETPDNNYLSSLKKQEVGVPDDQIVQNLVESYGIEAAVGQPGRIILFDCNLLHGSNGNIIPAPRSNLFFVYNALSNRVGKPFGDTKVRPEYIAAREDIRPLKKVINT